jgi:type I restriction enzyme, R subunit
MKYTDYFRNKTNYITRRKRLRRNATRAEKLFWIHARSSQLGYKFRRQFQIGKYITDFYCHNIKLIVEIDGITHDDERQQQYDAKRQAYLESLGYLVVRYTDDQVLCDTEATMRDIKNICDKRKALP